MGKAAEKRSGRMGRSGRRSILVAMLAVLAVLSSAAAAWATGELSQKPGLAGCISGVEKTAGECARGVGLKQAGRMAISPDGKNVYVGAYGSSGVTILARDPDTGALTQRAGAAACVSELRSEGCAPGRAIDEVEGVAISPDGKSVYGVGVESASVAVFDRRPEDGSLVQKRGKAGCISESGDDDCQKGKGLEEGKGAVVSPDGRNVYVVSQGRRSGALTVFARSANGELRQLGGKAGCFAGDGNHGECEEDPSLGRPYYVTVSPDGRNVYVNSTDVNTIAIYARNPKTGALSRRRPVTPCSALPAMGPCEPDKAFGADTHTAISPDGRSAYITGLVGFVGIFDRDPQTGALTQKPGLAGCFGDGKLAGSCQIGRGLSEVQSVAISPDGASVYVSSYAKAFVAVFDRDGTTGELRQKPGAAGCFSQRGAEDGCTRAKAIGFTLDIAVSPDGNNLYVPSVGSSAVAIFDRKGP
jgi:DNA-binding beta-propeller fold protein YncE